MNIQSLWFSVEENVMKREIDWCLWSVLADALEEDSQNKTAKTIRWMVENKKCPFFWRSLNRYEWSTYLLPYNTVLYNCPWELPKNVYITLPNLFFHSLYHAITELSNALEEQKLI